MTMKSILKLGGYGKARVLSFMLIAAMVWLFPVSNAAAVPTVLDDFDSPTSPLQAVTIFGAVVNGYDSDASNAALAVGGTRFIDIGVVSQSGGLTSSAVVSAGGATHRYTFQLPDGVDGSGSIVWNGTLTDPPAGCSLNLDLSDYSAFILREVTADHPFNLTMTVWNSDCTASTTRVVNIPVETLVTHNVPFNLFTTPSILAGTVGRISIAFQATGAATSLDWSFHALEVECIESVPTATLTAVPTYIVPPACSNLCWTITGLVTSAEIDHGIGAVVGYGL